METAVKGNVVTKIDFVERKSTRYTVLEVKSESNPKVIYRVDVTNQRCSCPGWLYQRGGFRKPCKHLRQFGYTEVTGVSHEQPIKVGAEEKAKIAPTLDNDGLEVLA